MIVGVSTVKDTAANVTSFVARNLAHGLDHLVVFTEETGPDAEAVLDAHPHVTHVPTGRGWWHERPDDLNVRQRRAANLARVALAPFAWAEWVVHIDGDEVVLFDRGLVDALPTTVRTLHLEPLEAVSRRAWPEGRVTHFKRLLNERELNLLLVLGLVDETVNKAYFHGHVRGKRGVRVRHDLRLGLHTVKGGDGGWVKGHSAPWLRLAHLDSATEEEFARKWMTLSQSGSRAVYRKTRIPMVRALRSLSRMDLTDAVRETYLRRIYERCMAEDFDTLHDLGLLEAVDLDAGTHTPELAPEGDRQALQRLLDAAAGRATDTLTLDDVMGGYDVLDDLLAATGVPAGPAADVLERMRAKERAARRRSGPAGSAPATGADEQRTRPWWRRGA